MILRGVCAAAAAAVAVAGGVATPAGAREPTGEPPAPVITAGCAGPPQGSVSAPGSHSFSHSFTPRVSGALTRAEIAVTKPPGTSGDWIVEVHRAVRIPIGDFEQHAIASTTIPDRTVPTGPSTLVARFADPALVFSGAAPKQEYELVVTRPRSPDLTVGYRRGGCPGVLAESGPSGAVFSPVLGGDADLVFGAYVVDVAPPITRIARGPRRRTDRHRARFELRASEPVSEFRCRLDREPVGTCGSTERLRVRRGRHVLRARAVDLAGNADPTPAKLRWRVTR